MKLIKSLKEIKSDEKLFPIYFWDAWLKLENGVNNKISDCFIFYDEINSSLIPFKITNLKLLRKADYIYCPLNCSGNILNPEIELKTIENFHEFLKEKNLCDVILPPGHYCLFQTIPKNSTYFKMGLIQKEITDDPTTIFNSMNSNFRNEIRKLNKVNNIEISFDKMHFNKFFDMYINTHARQQIQYDSIKHFHSLMNMFPENFLIGTIHLENMCLSSVFILFDSKTAYYQYAGNMNNPLYPGANKLLLFETFKELKKIGVNSINLGGFREAITKTKKQEGIQSFKMRFGAEKTFGIHFIHVLKPLNFFIFNFALRIKSFLKRKDLSLINLSGLELKKSK